jgi:hypothetical protein
VDVPGQALAAEQGEGANPPARLEVEQQREPM